MALARPTQRAAETAAVCRFIRYILGSYDGSQVEIDSFGLVPFPPLDFEAGIQASTFQYPSENRDAGVVAHLSLRCSQIAAPPQSKHLSFRRLCSQICDPPQSKHLIDLDAPVPAPFCPLPLLIRDGQHGLRRIVGDALLRQDVGALCLVPAGPLMIWNLLTLTCR